MDKINWLPDKEYMRLLKKTTAYDRFVDRELADKGFVNFRTLFSDGIFALKKYQKEFEKAELNG